ncbi:MAG: ATP-binding protein [Deltaproteobacteria bacterium]|nr:ATP-binding protein [Deltaproteobacteria bacterium]
MKYRYLSENIKQIQSGPRGRLLVLTGARQTGKTTLVRHLFPGHHYLSMEDPHVRVEFERLSASDWAVRYPSAIIDEVQKLPSLFEVLKAAYDSYPDVRYLLLGSSQILLLKKVRESLAGRVAIQELFPLTLPEILSESREDKSPPSRLLKLVGTKEKKEIISILQQEVSADSRFAKAQEAWGLFLNRGGMPALYNPDFSEGDLKGWMEDYLLTYLQRDLSDLAQLERLEPFVKCQRALAARSGRMVNFAELARLAEVSPPTARKFLQYMELSYQTILLPAYFKNEDKRLSKMPKIHFLDPAVRRGLLRRQGEIDGLEFESSVVAEVYKQIKTFRIPASLYHLRTVDGREIDLILETEEGFIAIECKLTGQVAKSDFRHLVGLEGILGKPLLAGIVVSQEPRIKVWDNDLCLISVPAAYLLT